MIVETLVSFLLYAFVFLFGIAIGSFLNVVILRYGSSSLGGSSGCFSCGHRLKWFDLIPIMSFLFLEGRCRYCGSRISLQYPLVEFFTGLLFLLIALTTPSLLEGVVLMVTTALLIVIFVYDLRHKIIPNGLVYAFIALGFIHGTVNVSTFTAVSNTGLSLLAGLMLFVFFFALWWYSKGRWMGLGDAKLALGIGLFLSFTEAITAIILAFWLGSVMSLGIIGAQKFFNHTQLFQNTKHLTIKSEIPFAPFLIAGFLLVVFLQFDLIRLLGY